MAIAAGRLNRRVTLLAPQTQLTAAHEATTNHRPVWRVWAEIKQESVDEGQTDGQQRANVRYTVTMRYRDDVNETWRLLIDGREMPISSAVERGVKEETVITAFGVR